MPDLWLPFTQDTRQQGLSNASVTTVGSGASINANGKLGKCYYLDGTSNGYISTDFPTDVGTDDFTISLWVKIPTISSGTYFTIVSSKQSPAISVGVGLYWNYSQKKFLWSTADGTNTTEIWTADTLDSIVYDKWIHLVMVRDNNDAKKGYFYINGTRYELASVPVIRNITTATNLWIGKLSSGQYPLKMYISDLRFWKNKALSPKEIEILSRGLVCHYPLNGNGRGGDNIISGTSPNEVQYTYPSSSYSDKFSKTSTIIPSASQYILSFWAKSTHAGDKVRAHWYSPNTTTKAETNQGLIVSVVDGQIDFTLSDKWEKYWCVWTQSSTTAVKHFIFPRMFSQASGGATGTGTVSVKCVKLEEGNIPTPWMPNQADSAYSAMGYDSTTEYDVSGNGYNGTKEGTITYSSNSPRYSVSTYFTKPSGIFCPLNLTLSQFTIAFWGKHPAANNKMLMGSNASLSSLNTYWYWYGDQSFKYPSGEFYYNHDAGAYQLNTWMHFVAVYNGSNITIYRNGVNEGSKAVTGNMTLQNLSIGNGYNQTSYWEDGGVSDFRLYVTALTEAQVKELYNTAVSVSNNGALLGYELIEN